jgi:hypothetical protein
LHNQLTKACLPCSKRRASFWTNATWGQWADISACSAAFMTQAPASAVLSFHGAVTSPGRKICSQHVAAFSPSNICATVYETRSGKRQVDPQLI